jgi:hypothetical protein
MPRETLKIVLIYLQTNHDPMVLETADAKLQRLCAGEMTKKGGAKRKMVDKRSGVKPSAKPTGKIAQKKKKERTMSK